MKEHEIPKLSVILNGVDEIHPGYGYGYGYGYYEDDAKIGKTGKKMSFIKRMFS